jgi:hypothetical protein
MPRSKRPICLLTDPADGTDRDEHESNNEFRINEAERCAISHASESGPLARHLRFQKSD